MTEKILISGFSGLIGSAIISHLESKGHNVVRLVRSLPKHDQHNTISWNIERKEIPLELLENFDAVIHLAGANIADHRWTPQHKKNILNSRVESTQLLASALMKLKHPPKVFFCASAIGYYGNHNPEKIIDENHPVGHDFLADVCRRWEEATQPAQKTGIRVVNLRFRVVLSPKGGALAKMLPIFKLGLGGPLGSGQQVMSWIALEEIPRILSFLLETEDISGPINCVAPQPVSNKGFTKILGQVVHRPTFFPAPSFGIRLLLGEMADALLLGGALVIPKKLIDANYQFNYPDLRSALKFMF